MLAALTAWGIADRVEPLGKRLSRAELDVLIKETGLDQQLKALGYWDAWQSGARAASRKLPCLVSEMNPA